jgi:hypothetical protein
VPSLNCARAAPLCATCCSHTCPLPHRPRAGSSSPRHAALPPARAALRRCSPSLQPDRCHLLLLAAPRVAPRPTAALVLPAVFSRTRHAAPATARAPPAAAMLAAGRQHQLSLTVPSLPLEAHLGAPNTLPLMFPHPPFHCHFHSRPPRLIGPPPQLQLAVDNRHRRFSSPIQCS